MEQQVLTALVGQAESGGGGAKPGGEGAAGDGCQQMSGMLFPILLMFVIIYFLIMRPQQKQQKKLRSMLAAIKKGDKIITNAGILCTITGLTDTVATVEIAKNVHIRILRGQIAGMQPNEGEKGSEAMAAVPEENK